MANMKTIPFEKRRATKIHHLPATSPIFERRKEPEKIYPQTEKEKTSNQNNNFLGSSR